MPQASSQDLPDPDQRKKKQRHCGPGAAVIVVWQSKEEGLT
jgi:hypothetical protein